MCKRGMVDEAVELFDQIEKLRCGPSVVTFNALINGLCKAHKLKEVGFCSGLTLSDSRADPDIITCNILINAYCRACNIEGAYMLFEELQKNGLSPDCVTYRTLIKGLYIVDREVEAFNIFKHMREAGREPTLSVYKTLMTWLCKKRKRKVSLALSLYLKYLKSLPSRDTDSISAL
jgi:pentatricopeptide repeat protein